MKSRHVVMILIAMALTGAVAITSCKKDKAAAAPAAPVSFKADIVPILTAKCAINSACHAGASNEGDNIELDSATAYSSIIANRLLNTSNPSGSLIYVEVSSGTMPKAPYPVLPASEVTLILNWIAQGAANN